METFISRFLKGCRLVDPNLYLNVLSEHLILISILWPKYDCFHCWTFKTVLFVELSILFCLLTFRGFHETHWENYKKENSKSRHSTSLGWQERQTECLFKVKKQISMQKKLNWLSFFFSCPTLFCFVKLLKTSSNHQENSSWNSSEFTCRSHSF